MEYIDSHQHFWQYDPQRYEWISSEMAVLQRDFLPQHLESELVKNIIDGSVAVQADQTERETEFLLDLAHENDFIKGVVGWLDLKDPQVEMRLEKYHEEKWLKGLRHIVQDEPDPEFMLQAEFQKGISQLERYDLTYDILVYPKQLDAAVQLARKFPNQKFVLDHLAKPDIANGVIDPWKTQITELSKCENVHCKISGMVTEADWGNWEVEEFIPYLDVVLEAFGTRRLMFGSDWPVCTLSAKYGETKSIIDFYLADFSEDEQDDIMGNNAIEFYRL